MSCLTRLTSALPSLAFTTTKLSAQVGKGVGGRSFSCLSLPRSLPRLSPLGASWMTHTPASLCARSFSPILRSPIRAFAQDTQEIHEETIEDLFKENELQEESRASNAIEEEHFHKLEQELLDPSCNGYYQFGKSFSQVNSEIQRNLLLRCMTDPRFKDLFPKAISQSEYLRQRPQLLSVMINLLLKMDMEKITEFVDKMVCVHINHPLESASWAGLYRNHPKLMNIFVERFISRTIDVSPKHLCYLDAHLQTLAPFFMKTEAGINFLREKVGREFAGDDMLPIGFANTIKQNLSKGLFEPAEMVRTLLPTKNDIKKDPVKFAAFCQKGGMESLIAMLALIPSIDPLKVFTPSQIQQKLMNFFIYDTMSSSHKRELQWAICLNPDTQSLDKFYYTLDKYLKVIHYRNHHYEVHLDAFDGILKGPHWMSSFDILMKLSLRIHCFPPKIIFNLLVNSLPAQKRNEWVKLWIKNAATTLALNGSRHNPLTSSWKSQKDVRARFQKHSLNLLCSMDKLDNPEFLKFIAVLINQHCRQTTNPNELRIKFIEELFGHRKNLSKSPLFSYLLDLMDQKDIHSIVAWIVKDKKRIKIALNSLCGIDEDPTNWSQRKMDFFKELYSKHPNLVDEYLYTSPGNAEKLAKICEEVNPGWWHFTRAISWEDHKKCINHFLRGL